MLRMYINVANIARTEAIQSLAGTHCRQMGVIANVHVAKKKCLHKLFFRLKKCFFFSKAETFHNFLPIMLLLLEFHILPFLRTSIFGFCTFEQFFDVLS